ENDYAVLACDGVWDTLAPNDVMGLVRAVIDPGRASEEISKMAFDRGSRDNITAIVLDLREYVKELKRERMEIAGIVDYGV
ncbi:MAG: hypothetical protein H6R39_311, partial [Deltaproteobacteria bacterium]|nr:hypothetical protein [Deltaproteobacteria bacterium]